MRAPLPSDFTTPRRPASHSGGSSSRRVVRSALEMMLDASTPELHSSHKRSALQDGASLGEVASSSSPPPRPVGDARKATFTVSYTSAPAAISTVQKGGVALPSGDGEGDVFMQRGYEKRNSYRSRSPLREPSALQFLSPAPKGSERSGDPVKGPSGRRSGERRSQPTRQRSHGSKEKATTSKGALPGSAKATSAWLYQAAADERGSTGEDATLETRSTMPRSGRDEGNGTWPSRPRSPSDGERTPQTSRSLSAEVERMAEEDEPEVVHPRSATQTVMYDHHFSEHELREYVQLALEQYEQQRDAEETAVLQEIRCEIEDQGRRYEELLKVNASIVAENETLRDKLEKSGHQREMLETSTVQSLRADTKLAQERCNELQRQLMEAQKRHSNDAVQEGMLDQMQWKTREADLLRQLQEAEEQLAKRTLEVDELKIEAARRDDEIRCLHDDRHRYLDECEEVRRSIRSLGSRMSEMESVLKEREATIAQLTKKLRAVENGAQKASETLHLDKEHVNEQVRSLKEEVQKKVGELQHHSHRMSVLEGEKKTRDKEVRRLSASLQDTAEQYGDLHRALDTVLLDARRCLKKAFVLPAASASDALPQKSKGTSPSLVASLSPVRHEQTQVFDTTCEDSVHNSSGEWQVPSTISMNEDDNDEHLTEDSVSLPGSFARKPAEAQRSRSTGALASGLACRGTVARRTVSAEAALTTSTSRRRIPGREEGANDALRLVARRYSACMRVTRQLRGTITLLHTRSRDSIVRWRASNGELTGQLKSYKERVILLEDACRFLKAKLESHGRDYDAVRTECQLRGTDLEMLNGDLVRAHEELACRERQRMAAEDQRDELAKVKRELEGRVVSLAHELDSCRAKCHTLESSLTNAETELSTLKSKLVDHEATAAQLAEAQEKRVMLQERLRKAQEQQAIDETERRALAEGNATFEAKIKGLMAEMQADRSHQQCLYDREVRDKQAKMEELLKAREELALITAQEQTNRMQMDKDRAAFHEMQRSLEETVAALQKKVSRLQRRLIEVVGDADLRRQGEQTTLWTLLDLLKSYRHGEPGEGQEAVDPPSGGCTGVRERSPVSRTAAPDSRSKLVDDATPPGREALSASLLTKSSDSPEEGATTVRFAWPVSGVPLKENGAAAGGDSTPTLRRQAVASVQRAVLELTRLQTQLARPAEANLAARPLFMGEGDDHQESPAGHHRPQSLFESFLNAERQAGEMARLSADKRRSLKSPTDRCDRLHAPFASGSNNALAPQGEQYFDTFPSPRLEPASSGTLSHLYRSPVSFQRRPIMAFGSSLGFPCDAVTAGTSPPPRVSATFLRQRHPNVPFTTEHTTKRDLHPAKVASGPLMGFEKRLSDASAYAGGFCRSRSSGGVDGSCSPPRPPLLRSVSSH